MSTNDDVPGAAEFHPPGQQLRGVFARLFADDFPGRAALVEQLRTCRVRTITEYADEYGSVEIQVDPAAPRAKVVGRVPVEAEWIDIDSVPVYWLLHVVDGVMEELEVYKADGYPVRGKPRPEDLAVRVKEDMR